MSVEEDKTKRKQKENNLGVLIKYSFTSSIRFPAFSKTTKAFGFATSKYVICLCGGYCGSTIQTVAPKENVTFSFLLFLLFLFKQQAKQDKKQ